MATKSSKPPCGRCGDTGWLIVERAGVSSAGRCACMPPVPVRAVPLQRAEPILTADEISLAVEGLASIPWFPKEEGARTMIADAIARLCTSGPACFEMVRRMVDRYKEWPGAREMRICYCALIGSPLSGEDLHLAVSEYYPDGFGTSKPAEAWQPAALPPGCVVSADRQLDESIKSLAVAKDLNRPRLRLPVAPAPRVLKDPLTPERRAEIQAQIDRAMGKL